MGLRKVIAEALSAVLPGIVKAVRVRLPESGAIEAHDRAGNEVQHRSDAAGKLCFAELTRDYRFPPGYGQAIPERRRSGGDNEEMMGSNKRHFSTPFLYYSISTFL